MHAVAVVCRERLPLDSPTTKPEAAQPRTIRQISWISRALRGHNLHLRPGLQGLGLQIVEHRCDPLRQDNALKISLAYVNRLCLTPFREYKFQASCQRRGHVSGPTATE